MDAETIYNGLTLWDNRPALVSEPLVYRCPFCGLVPTTMVHVKVKAGEDGQIGWLGCPRCLVSLQTEPASRKA